MTFRRLAIAAAAALLLGASAPADSTASMQGRVKAAAATYLANLVPAAKVTGRDTAFDYYARLNDDLEILQSDIPKGYDAEMWTRTANGIARLDVDLVSQILSGNVPPLGSIRGLGETMIKSSKDGTMQPVAAYVPSSYQPGKPMALIVFLHGHPQSESELLAPVYIGELAERTNTIVVAPYGRGYYDYKGSESDVYDAYDAAMRAFTIDSRKRYLAGYSMGGFSVYHVAPLHPDDWTAVMSIAGALLGSESTKLVTSMRYKQFYVLTGTDDDNIPTQYPTISAAFLRQQGMDISFYSQPHGTHRLSTLLPILTQAWDDMERGIIRTAPPGFGAVLLPSAPAPMNVKT